MKKQLLIGSALLAAATAFSQNGNVKARITGITNMTEKLAQKYAAADRESNITSGKAAPAQQQQNQVTSEAQSTDAALSPVTSATWQAIGGSMNIFGMLVSQSKPLNFTDNLNAVSFIHRKGNATTTQPTSNSGSILARISTNWGASWDSTCIWADANNWARYPTGGIFNPQGNSNLSNAYVFGMGPVTDPVANVGWKGNWYGVKQLGAGNYNMTASAAPSQMQFIANTPPYNTGLAKHDFARYNSSSTDDGKIRVVAGRYDAKDGNGQPTGFRGAAIVKGSFAGGVVTWTSDTIIPSVIQSSVSSNLWGQPQMAWNESGTTGYVVFIGANNTYSANNNTPNKGWQPIVYKTTNSGTSWSSIPGIDFTAPSMSVVTDFMATVNTNTALAIPFFNIGEGYDMTVDGAGKLHIVTTVVGAARNHNDSLSYTYQFGTAGYSWGHVPGFRPYIYDFVGDGAGAWNVMIIDSMSSEGPGAASTAPGYTANPWDADPANSNAKVTSDSRLQVSRTPDGNFLVYSWAESDTAFTNGQEKWNTLPNIKARLYEVSTGSLSPTEINVTKPTTGANPNVSNRAMFHYMSPTNLYITCLGAGATSSVQVRVPFTVSNSNPYSQLTENKHWYSSANLDFALASYCTGFNQSLAYNVNNVEVYPNPVSSNATVAVDLKEEGNVTIDVYNTVGQLMQTANTKGQIGVNKVNIDVNNLSTGIYMVKVKVGNTVSTKKIIVE